MHCEPSVLLLHGSMSDDKGAQSRTAEKINAGAIKQDFPMSLESLSQIALSLRRRVCIEPSAESDDEYITVLVRRHFDF